MSTPQNLTIAKVSKISTGVILLAISAAMRLAPAGIRDDSGFSYILVMMLLTIGSVLIFKGFTSKPE